MAPDRTDANASDKAQTETAEAAEKVAEAIKNEIETPASIEAEELLEAAELQSIEHASTSPPSIRQEESADDSSLESTN